MSDFQMNKYKKSCSKTNKVTLENIMKSNAFFDEKNPITYKLFLKKRPDLSQEEVEHYTNLIYELETETQEEMQYTNDKMRDHRTMYCDKPI